MSELDVIVAKQGSDIQHMTKDVAEIKDMLKDHLAATVSRDIKQNERLAMLEADNMESKKKITALEVIRNKAIKWIVGASLTAGGVGAGLGAGLTKALMAAVR